MKRYSVLGVALILMSIAFTGCGDAEKGPVVYPNRHLVAMYPDEDAIKSNSASVWLNWGDKLIVDESVQVTNKDVVYYKVKYALVKSTGFVSSKDVVMNVITPAVILNRTIIYATPSPVSRTKRDVEPPVLAYITEIKEDNWAYILPYNSPAQYNLSGKNTALWGVNWINMNDISTNSADVQLVIGVQLSLYKLHRNRKASEEVLEEVKETEAQALENLMTLYPQSPAILYVRQALEKIAPQRFSTDPLLDITNDGLYDDTYEEEDDGDYSGGDYFDDEL
jgi:predicted small lipoprotein YifL